MMRPRTLYTLTQRQIDFGCVLTDEPMPIPELKRKVNKEAGYTQKVHWRALVRLGIAERCDDHLGAVRLKRGPEWRAFYQRYGEENVRRGLVQIEIDEEVGRIFQSLPKAKILRFPGPRSVTQGRPIRLITR